MKTKKVLIAYEEDASARSLANFLQGFGYKVERAHEVSQIVRSVRHDKVDVILIDDEVEGVKACDLVPLVKSMSAKIQIIVISSEESLGLLKRLRGAGIFYQAMKPIDLDEIRSAVMCAFEKIERENPKEGFFPFFLARLVPA